MFGEPESDAARGEGVKEVSVLWRRLGVRVRMEGAEGNVSVWLSLWNARQTFQSDHYVVK